MSHLPQTLGPSVRHLVELASQRSEQSRATLYLAVTDLFEDQGESLSPGERELMLSILRRLSREVEMSVRRKLAERLAREKNPSRDLLQMLANDEIAVAHDILANCDTIQDVALIEVVRHRTQQHQMAIAIRRNLSTNLCDALVETGNEDVIVALLDNRDAQISDAALAYLAEESRRIDRYQQPLVRRPDLPPAVAKRMCQFVSSALRAHIINNFKIDVQDLDDVLNETVHVVVQESQSAREPSPAQKLVDKLSAANELSHGFVVRALRQGQVALFELGFAELVGLDPRIVRRILYEPGGEALAVACKSIAFDPAVFLTVYRLTREAQACNEDASEQQVTRAGRFYASLAGETARTVVERWNADPTNPSLPAVAARKAS